MCSIRSRTVQNQRSSLRGDQLQSGQRMRGPEWPKLFSWSASRSKTAENLAIHPTFRGTVRRGGYQKLLGACKICSIAKEVSYMALNWSKDIDQTLVAAKEGNRPILLDFSAAPA